MDTKETNEQRIIRDLRACGHFLYYKMGSKTGRRRIFAVLLRHGDIPQRRLQDILDVKSGSLSEILAKTEHDGLIERIRSRDDKRQQNLRLTEAGRTQALLMQAEYERRVDYLTNCFTPEQKETLLSLLDVLVDHWYAPQTQEAFGDAGEAEDQ